MIPAGRRCLQTAFTIANDEFLAQLEQDEREPTLSIAARIARALGLSLDELSAGVAS